jgi:hypothetical protein
MLESRSTRRGIGWVLAVLVVAPLTLALVYGTGVPPSTECWEDRTPDAVVDAYRSRGLWLIGLAELAVLGAYAVSLRAAAGRASRATDASIALTAAGVGVGVASAYVTSDQGDGFRTGALIALLVAVPLWLGLRAAADRPVTLGAGIVAAVAALVLTIVAWVVALFAIFATAFVLVGLVVSSVVAVGVLVDRQTWRAAALTCAFFAVVVVPLAAVIIVSRGHGPAFC